MADVSLDDYIQKKNFTTQIRNVGNTNRTGKKIGFVKGRVKFSKQASRGINRTPFRSAKNIVVQKQKNGQVSLQKKGNNIISLQTKKNKGLQDKSNVNALSVTVPNKSGFNKGVFDARDKIAAAKRPADARDKLAAKAKLSDARMKIQQIKGQQQNENKSGQITVTGLGKTLKTINTEVKSPNFTRTLTNQVNPQGGVQMSGNSLTITRKISNSGGIESRLNDQENSSTNFKITRTLNQGIPQGGVQMSGNSMTITRNIGNTSAPSGNPMTIARNIGNSNVTSGNSITITRNISNTGVSSSQYQNIKMTNNRGPVIQMTNDKFEIPVDPPLEGYYEYDEPVGYHYNQPPTKTHVTEKTLTVKYPQSVRQNPIPVVISKPPPKPAVAVKRKIPTQAPIKLSTSGPLKLAGGPLKLAQPTMVADTVVAKKPKLVKLEPEDDVPFQDTTASPTLTSPLQGYKIAITNLHPVVSQDDIIELFGAVGPMKRARLIKDGVAEVVYVQKDDAAKAIQKYHNRELDGIPMQVKSVTPPPAPVPKKTAVSTPSEDALPLKAEPLKLFKGNTKNVPESDIETGTLHRALFKTGITQPSKLVTFTVKI